MISSPNAEKAQRAKYLQNIRDKYTLDPSAEYMKETTAIQQMVQEMDRNYNNPRRAAASRLKQKPRTFFSKNIHTYNHTEMQIRKFFVMAAVAGLTLCGTAVLTSCSNDDKPVVPDTAVNPGTPQRTYDLSPRVVEERTITGMKELAGGILANEFRQIIVEYTSVGPDLKTPVRLTGSISMHPGVFGGQDAPRAVVVYNEYTNAKHRERASQDVYDELSLYCNAQQHFIVLAADLYGWTLTEDRPQTYCCPDVIGTETLDFYDAAMQVLDQRGYVHQGLPRLNVGYSGGGFSAMAVQKFVDEQRPDIDFLATAAGAAPFDINTVYRQLLSDGVSGYPCSVPLVVVALNETYGLGLDYGDIFAKPLADNVAQWILSKDYNTWEINALIAGDTETAGHCDISRIITPQAMNLESTVGRRLTEAFRRYSLCGEGIDWQPSRNTHFYLLHSAADNYLGWQVGQEMADYLESKGCDVSADFEDYDGHVENGLLFFNFGALLSFENALDSDNNFVEQWLDAFLELLLTGDLNLPDK